MKTTFKLIFAILPILSQSAAFGGWIQTAVGTYDYNDPANWEDGTPDGVFPATLALEGAQTITFETDTELPTGLQIEQTGAFGITFKAASGSISLAAGDDFTNTGSGSVSFESSVKVDLGGKVRTLTTGQPLTISGVISNGGIRFANTAQVTLWSANTYALGTWLTGSGVVRAGANNCLGAAGSELHICAGARLEGQAKYGTNSFADLHVFLEGDATFGSTDKDLGGLIFNGGQLTIARPLTLRINRYQHKLPPVSVDSPYKFTDIAFVGDTVNLPTLRIDDVIVGEGETLEMSYVNVLSFVNKADFKGTLKLYHGSVNLGTFTYNKTTYADVVFPDATIDAENASVNLSADNGGSFSPVKRLVLRSGVLNVSGSTKAATSFAVDSIAFEPGLATAQVKMTDNGTSDVVLSVRSVTGNHAMVNFPEANAALGGLARFVVEDGSDLMVDGVIPWMRGAKGQMMTYDDEVGVRLLSDDEISIYDESSETFAFTNDGEQVVFAGAVKATLVTNQTAGSVAVLATGTTAADQPVLTAVEGVTLKIASGALDVYTMLAGNTEGAKFSIPADFGTNVGYVTSRNGYRVDFTAPFHGSGGLVIGDLDEGMNRNKEGRGINLRNGGSDYTGDVYVYGCVLPYENGVFPYGERVGDLYLYGSLSIAKYVGANIHVNGFFGNGEVYQEGSATATLTVGDGDSDGNFEGTFGTGTGSNFTFVKVGKGWQRIANSLATKYSIAVNGGTLQLDGDALTDSRFSIDVAEGACLAGCGTFTVGQGVNLSGLLAPGSAEVPTKAMTIKGPLKMNATSSLKFYIGDDRAAQVIVAEGRGLTGDLMTIPVTIDCRAKKGGSWLLLEADSFGGKTFEKAKDGEGRTVSGRLSVVQVKNADGDVVREQLWFTRTQGLIVILK